MAQFTLPRDGGPELPLYGMNTLHNAKQLKRNVFALLENMFPGISGKPRNGMNEVMKSTTALGYGTVHSFFRPHALYYATGGKEFFFIWHKNATTTDEFGLEIWNLTDNTRTLLTYGDFNQTQVYISLKPLYNAIYMTMEYEMATSHENAYRTKNKILEWSGSAWTCREMGIDVAPACGEITIGEDESYELPLYLTQHQVLVYKGKMWIIGGYNGSAASQKVFSSDNGKNWTEVGLNCLPTALRGHFSLVFSNKMWVLGGITGSSSYSEKVYYSTDGLSWVEAGTDSLPVGLASGVGLVYDSKMWLLGGTKSSGTSRKAYYSTDGLTWYEAGTDSLPWSTTDAVGWVYDSKMWTTFSDWQKIYYSTNGVTWTEAGSSSLPDQVLSSFGCVYDSKMWLMGGAYATLDKRVYYSTDGVTWTQAGSEALPYALDYAVAVSFDSNMYIIGGRESSTTYKKNIYRSSDGATWTLQTVNAIEQNKYVNVAYTFVKLSATGLQTVFTEALIESIEDLDKRQLVQVTSVGAYGLLLIPMPQELTDALAQGATHLRIWRTLGGDSSSVAEGLALRYCEDIPLSGTGYGASYVHHSQIPDSALAGETHTLEMTGYEAPPMGRFFDFDTRAWIGGNPSNAGYWFYSETPLNVQYPQKYAAMFKTASGYWIACDPTDGQYDTGTVLLKGDRYFFKERKIFGLAGADPANVVTLISPNIGCAFPQTITRMFVPQLGGECIGFLSESGPAVLLPGGQVRLLTEFTIAELWPTKTGLIKKSTGIPTSWYTRNTVTAGFWNNTWWIFSGDSRDTSNELTTNKIFGFHFGNDGESIGPFQVTIPQYSGATIFEPLILVPVDNNRAYVFSHKATGAGAITYRLAKFLDPSKYEDTFVNEGAISYDMIAETGYRNVGPRPKSQALLERSIVYISFNDAAGLVVTVTSDNGRLVSSCTYAQERQSGVAADNAVRDFVSIDALSNDAHFGSKFKTRVAKTVPADGDVEFFGSELELNSTENEAEFSGAFAAPTGATTFVTKAGQELTDESSVPLMDLSQNPITETEESAY